MSKKNKIIYRLNSQAVFLCAKRGSEMEEDKYIRRLKALLKNVEEIDLNEGVYSIKEIMMICFVAAYILSKLHEANKIN